MRGSPQPPAPQPGRSRTPAVPAAPPQPSEPPHPPGGQAAGLGAGRRDAGPSSAQAFPPHRPAATGQGHGAAPARPRAAFRPCSHAGRGEGRKSSRKQLRSRRCRSEPCAGPGGGEARARRGAARRGGSPLLPSRRRGAGPGWGLAPQTPKRNPPSLPRCPSEATAADPSAGPARRRGRPGAPVQSREPLTLVAMALPLRARLPLCPPRRGPRLLARRVRPARRRWAAQAAPPHLPRSPPPPGGRWAAQQRWAGGGWCGGRTVPPPLSPCTPARRAGAVAGPLCTPLAAGAGGREGSAGGAPGESPRPGPEGGRVPIPRARSAFTFRSGFASNSYSWYGAAPGLWSTPRRRRRGQPCSGRQRPLKNS